MCVFVLCAAFGVINDDDDSRAVTVKQNTSVPEFSELRRLAAANRSRVSIRVIKN